MARRTWATAGALTAVLGLCTLGAVSGGCLGGATHGFADAGGDEVPAAGDDVPTAGATPTQLNDGTLQPDGTYSKSALYVGGPPRAWPPPGVAALPPEGQACDVSLDAAGQVPATVPQAYFNLCAGCHGPTGGGGNGYPAATTRRSYAAFASLARVGYTGSRGLMPHFDAAHLSDADLVRVYAYLAGARVVEGGNCTPLPVADAATTAATIERGLEAWRTQDAAHHDGVACYQCHGVDALNLAYFGYADGDLLRRAQKHVDEPQMWRIVDMVHALRQQFALARRDPLAARPLQPGGVVLPGATTAERDLNFGLQLRKMGLVVATGYINDGAAARTAAAQLGNINLHALRIPLPLNHLAEDAYHNPAGGPPDCTEDIDACADHGSLSDWMPIMPHVAKDANAVFRAHDAYRSNPNLATFYAVYGAVPAADSMPGTYPIGYNRDVDDNKYKAQHILDYCVRREALHLPGCYDGGPLPFDPNKHVGAIWSEGEYANLFGTGLSHQPACDVGTASCDPPQAPHFYGKLSKGAKLSDSMQRLRAPWFAAHWHHFDPTMLNTGDATIQQDEYFARDIFWSNNDRDYGLEAKNPTYSIYGLFQVMMHNIAVLGTPSSASCDKIPYNHPDLGPQTCTALDLRSGYFPQLCNFAEGKDWYNESNQQLAYVPQDAERRELYQTIGGNFYRMMLRGLINQLQEDNWMCDAHLQGFRIARAKKFLAQTQVVAANGAQDEEMFATLQRLMAASATRCPPLDTHVAAEF